MHPTALQETFRRLAIRLLWRLMHMRASVGCTRAVWKSPRVIYGLSMASTPTPSTRMSGRPICSNLIGLTTKASPQENSRRQKAPCLERYSDVDHQLCNCVHGEVPDARKWHPPLFQHLADLQSEVKVSYPSKTAMGQRVTRWTSQ